MMEQRTPEQFFSERGTTERYAPVDPATHDLPPVDAYEIEDFNVEIRSRRSNPQGDKPKLPPIVPKLVFPSSLRGLPIPEMEWIVDGWIPIGDVTLLYGDGGVGKTLLAQELMASTALGKPWCTLPARHCKSLGVFCEDDDNEMHRRQNDIQRFLETDFHDDRMDAMAWWCRKGEDNLLCTFDFEGVIQLTPFYFAIWDAAKEMGARLVILDTAADLFGGNENDRSQVRQFVGALSRLAMAINGAVVLNAHPSREGLKTGTGDSGSTGWSNSARSRLYLERVKAEVDEQVDTNERLLTKKKANRSSIGETIKLRWSEGVIASAGAASTGAGAAPSAATADAVFMAVLAQVDAEGRHLSASANAPNYAPKLFAKHPDRQGFTRKDFDAAMQRLFAAGRITNAEYGRANDRGRPRRIMAVGGGADA